MKNLFYIGIGLQIVMLLLSIDVFAATNPFDSIKTNADTLANDIIKIVQIVAVIGLVIYGGYCLFSGNLDKVRLSMIVVGIIIVSGAKVFVDFIATWVK